MKELDAILDKMAIDLEAARFASAVSIRELTEKMTAIQEAQNEKAQKQMAMYEAIIARKERGRK